MTSPILFAGQEDISFTTFGMVVATSGALQVDATAGRFRAGYARHALSMWLGGTNNGVPQNSQFLRTQPFSAASFWTTFRICTQATAGNPGAGAHFLRWVDSSGVVRLRVRNTSTALNSFVVEKVTAAAVATQLGAAWSSGLTANPNPPDKLDIFINYAVAGQVTIYINGLAVYSYAGDVTTDAATALAYFDIGGFYTPANANNGQNLMQSVSEVIVATRDTRSMSLLTQVATAAGNASQWTGAASDVNESVNSDATVNYSTTANQLQQYTITPAAPAGNFSILDLIHHGRVVMGSSGPTKFQFAVRTGGTDYFSGTIASTGAFATYAANWETNPNTSAAWTTAQIVNASTLFNLGVKSLA